MYAQDEIETSGKTQIIKNQPLNNKLTASKFSYRVGLHTCKIQF